MILVLNGGRSFKGAALYLLHDQRRDGEAERLTSERVGWTHTHNLPTDDPQRAWRMMVHTAMAAEELKKASGQVSTGRKLTKPVSTIVMSWKDEDKPTKEHQIEAAASLLKRLGLDDRQALIVAHNDSGHPHLHILINRVSPETGIAAPLKNSKKELQAWALEYQQERGQTHCPKREEKAQARMRGETVEATGRVSRTAYEFNRAVSNDNLSAAFVRGEQKQKDAALYQSGRDMHERHKKQWDGLKQAYQTGKGRIFDRAGERGKERAEEIKAGFKPRWGELFRQQRDERRAFEQRENSVLGTLFNMFMTASEIRRTGDDDLTPLAMVVVLFSHKERVNAFERGLERERWDLAREVSSAVGKGRDDLRGEARAESARLRTGYLDQCATLRTVQAQERQALKLAWSNRSAERKAAYAPLRDRAEKWRMLSEQGRKAREQGRGMVMQRRREMRRE